MDRAYELAHKNIVRSLQEYSDYIQGEKSDTERSTLLLSELMNAIELFELIVRFQESVKRKN
jgi:hypothetical protein